MKSLGLCLMLFVVSLSRAQDFYAVFAVDTVHVSTRIGGELDSIDLLSGVQSSSLPGGGWNVNENMFDPASLINFSGGQRFTAFSNWKKMYYSGLPHLGFGYSFGNHGTQMINTEYQQAFKGNWLLNINYNRIQSTSFLQNSDYSRDNLQVQLSKKGPFYSFELKGLTEKAFTGYNFGISTDTLLEAYALKFQPVNNSVARDSVRKSMAYLANYFDFNKDDSLVDAGIFTRHQLTVRNFVYYNESDSVYTSYNYDSLTTHDQYQWSQLSNMGGLFYRNRKVYAEAGISADYWRYANLGHVYDTLEVSLNARLHANWNKFRLSDVFYLNLTGASQGFSNQGSVYFNPGWFRLDGSVLLSYLLPMVNQRYMYANSYSSYLSNPQKEFKLLVQAGASKQVKNWKFRVGIMESVLKDNYFFIGNQWRNDYFATISFHQLNFSAALDRKVIHWHVKYAFTQASENMQIIPQQFVQTRFFVKGGVFKARKLKMYGGFDLNWHSAYQLVSYAPEMGGFDFSDLTLSSGSVGNLHLFGGFQIDDFKFYVRFENLGSLWNPASRMVMQNTPVQTLQFRLGITWDFFN